ncbi:ArgE/DapE family deacylase [Lactobacillus sp. DCY120]|uniref:Probable succinyl-diaminopimelate desuccinylase n=1 Tax=Bombilactobacillus apium TaxID=2675299 RepID=A0A850R0B2_9LACO|nr:ArgE/DapE family deacylase [Bombilactobacillus apium]NVY95790.1 ArgE/DapE family deacylase [Bombilactobacillus apium]
MQEAEKLAILEQLVSFPSVNDHELPVAQYLHDLLAQHGIDSQVLSLGGDRANLVAEIGSGQPVLALSGHLDVVEVNRDNWQTDPFQLTSQGDRLYGRGTTDMKAGLAALVIAMIELKEQNISISGTVRLLATAGEEVGQKGAQALYEAGYMQDVETLLIGEPSGYRAVYANKGELNLTLTAQGRAAHSSMPNLGINAVEHLLEFLQQLTVQIKPLIAAHPNATLGQTVFNIDQIQGGSQPNAIPGKAQAVLNIRTVPELANGTLVNLVEETLASYNQGHAGTIKQTVGMDIMPIVGQREAKIIQLIQKIAQPYLQNYSFDPAQLKKLEAVAQAQGGDYSLTEVVPIAVSGGTDASQLLIDQPQGANYVAFGPSSDNPHEDNEYISRQMYLDFIQIYQELITAYFNQ